MKRKSLVILLAIVCCMTVVLCACTDNNVDEKHVCKHVCQQCGGCTSDCTDAECANKCPGHNTPDPTPTPKHECDHVCPDCGKCTSECTDPVCADKCKGHIKVAEILVNTDDENDGTIANPRTLTVVQGSSAEFTYNIKPRDAENKKIDWTLGTIADGAFTAATEAKLTIADTGSKITVTAAADATGLVLQGKAADGSKTEVYVTITVEEYFPVTAIVSGNLKKVEDKDYDYELLTAKDTEWDMTDGILKRGQDLLDGKIFGGLQAPRNLTYYANIRNIGLTVEPSNASEKDVNIAYSQEGVVAIDALGNLKVLGAGETYVTISSVSEKDVAIKIKVTVADSLYRGITVEAYTEAAEAANVASGWDLDSDHGTEKQFSRYDDWHLVMVHSNEKRGGTGSDGNQKIFYMGESSRPYGICLENNVNAGSGASLEDSAAMMWAKVTIPESALTFNVKIGNNDKTYGEYRVVFVKEDGIVTVLSDGWVGFAAPTSESTQKFVIPDAIKGQKGALVIEHRMNKADANAELQIKVLKFEGLVAVSSVVFDNASATYKQGERTFRITAKVKPDNATNDKVTYEMAEGSAAGVTVDANGNVSVTAEAIGEYHIIAKAVADETKIAEFVLTITADEIEVNEWTNKSQLLNGVSDVKWEIVNGYNSGAGEGVDLSTELATPKVDYSAMKLTNRKVKSTSFIMAMSIRTFPNEVTAEIVVKVITADGTENVISTISGKKAIADNDPAHDGKIDTYYYDLSAYIGQTVTIELGVAKPCYHAVVTAVRFSGNELNVTEWKNKTAILNTESDAWAVNGTWNAGPGEGVDLQGANSYLSNEFVLGAFNAKFTFGARIFKGQEGDKGWPKVKLVVVANGKENIVKAIGATEDTVEFNKDDIVQTSYDLSAFIGQKVEIRIVCTTEVYHCVITNIAMGAIA